MKCTLCESEKNHLFLEDSSDYYRCENCHLIFMDPSDYLDSKTEKSRYEFHENDPSDQGYRSFLGKLVNPLLEYITPDAKGLDFGCGPGPTISVMLGEKRISCENYDPHFVPREDLLDFQYDFVTCTEACEHFYHPKKEFEEFKKLTKKGGYIGLMTKFYHDGIDFKSWHYRNDDTHVCFYSVETFEFLSQKYEWQIEKLGNDIVIFCS